MSTRVERITVEIEIPVDGGPVSETIAEVMGEIESGIQRTGLAYRFVTDKPQIPGREPFHDITGSLRTPNEWGFNSFASIHSASIAARELGRPGSTWYIWRLADGTYDHTAVPNPTTPGHPAELVDTFTLPSRRRRRPAREDSQ
jgi:hypothetical protein